MSTAMVKLTLGPVGARTSQHGGIAYRIGPDAFKRADNANHKLAIFWDHNPAHAIGHTMWLEHHDRAPQWVADIDTDKLARHTDRPLDRLGISPGWFKATTFHASNGASVVVAGTRCDEVSLTEHPAFSTTRIELIGQRPGSLFAEARPAVRLAASGRSGKRSILEHRTGLGQHPRVTAAACPKCRILTGCEQFEAGLGERQYVTGRVTGVA